MGASLVDRGVGAILAEAMSTDPETVLVVNPGRHTTRRIVEELSLAGSGPTVRLLATDFVLKDVLGDFLVGSIAADLIEAGRLELRTGAENAENALVLTDDAIIALIKMDGSVAGLSTEDGAFVDKVAETYLEYWDDATAFRLRTPALGRVQTTLEAEIGHAARSDFSAILDSLETARGNGEGLDEVTICLLVAARNEVLLYDISKWGEDVGIASKATFSRTKTELEEEGIIGTEKVPIDVGRPRLRLKLADERLQSAGANELAGIVMETLE